MFSYALHKKNYFVFFTEYHIFLCSIYIPLRKQRRRMKQWRMKKSET